jgi:hypothetical protein
MGGVTHKYVSGASLEKKKDRKLGNDKCIIHACVNMDMNKCLCLNVYARDVFTYHICRFVKRT